GYDDPRVAIRAKRVGHRGAEDRYSTTARGGMTLLIFDCDGVLVDSEVMAHQTLLDVLAPLGFSMTLEQSYGVFAGRSLKDTLAVIERQLGRPLPADILEQSRDLLFARFRAGLKPVAGITEAITALPHR